MLTKEEMRKGLKENMSEFTMMAEVIGEVLEENEELVAHVILPLAKQITTVWGETMTGMMAPLYKERILCLIESVDTLEKAGFTREQAIQLMNSK